jgi:hypothetical protein
MTKESYPTRAELLREYELCQNNAHNLESRIWQTGTAIGIGSIGFLIVVANHRTTEQPPWQVAAIIGILIFLMSLMWWYMARRWWSIQHAFFMRMRHIEEELGLYHARYIQYLDDPDSLSNSGLLDKYINEVRERATKQRGIVKVHQRKGIQEILALLPIAILLSWVIYTWWLFVIS